MNYSVGQLPPGTAPEILRELRAIAEALSSSQPFITLETQYKPPKKIVEGMMIQADGTLWNPGSGAGCYIYRSGAWRLLG